jgi:hypothetical protein
MAKAVDFPGSDAGFDVRFDEIKHFGAEAAGDAHFINFLGGFDLYGHG